MFEEGIFFIEKEIIIITIRLHGCCFCSGRVGGGGGGSSGSSSGSSSSSSSRYWSNHHTDHPQNQFCFTLNFQSVKQSTNQPTNQMPALTSRKILSDCSFSINNSQSNSSEFETNLIRNHSSTSTCTSLGLDLLIPTEIWIGIFSRLNLTDILSLSQVNRKFNQISHSSFIWRNVIFQLDSILQIGGSDDDDDDELSSLSNSMLSPLATTNACSSSSHNTITSQKIALGKKYPKSTSLWYLHSSEKHVNTFLLSFAPPTFEFLRLDSTRQRFQYIQALKLTNMTHPVTDEFLTELLALMPQLALVDLSSCSMLTDRVIKKLVEHDNRSRTLKQIKLKRCFSLTWKSLESIGTHCKALELLDLEGCGGVVDQGLMMLLLLLPSSLNTRRRQQQRSSDQTIVDISDCMQNLNPIAYTLKSIHLGAADLLSESALAQFLCVLTSVSPSESNLESINLSNTFCVSKTVLEHIYPRSKFNESTLIGPIEGGLVADSSVSSRISHKSPARTLNVNVVNCGMLMTVDIVQMTNRIHGLISTHKEFRSIKHVQVEHNCKLADDSILSVRQYLDSILGT